MRRRHLPKLIRVFELLGFFSIIVVIWLDEVLDLPHLLLGAPATPINYVESLFETAFVAFLAAFVVSMTGIMLRKIMAGILPMCAFCKKIRADDRWISIEDYIPGHSDADLSHGICPECLEKHYEELTDSNLSVRR